MNKVKKIIDNAVDVIIDGTSNEKNIKKIKKRHDVKTHFIPKRYRVFGGLLQSMNIKFGDFIEQLFQEVVINSNKYELESMSGIGRRKFTIAHENDVLIDKYISDRQDDANTTSKELSYEYDSLVNTINVNSLAETENSYSLSHDIDLFFKEKNKNNYYYAEIKYNDDHDSGKYVDINRKLIKTYAYLYEDLLNKYNRDASKFTLTPCMFFFTNKKMTGNIYLPEDTNIFRGKEIFETFFDEIKYDDIVEYLEYISEHEDTIKKFDKLYEKIMKITE